MSGVNGIRALLRLTYIRNVLPPDAKIIFNKLIGLLQDNKNLDDKKTAREIYDLHIDLGNIQGLIKNKDAFDQVTSRLKDRIKEYSPQHKRQRTDVTQSNNDAPSQIDISNTESSQRNQTTTPRNQTTTQHSQPTTERATIIQPRQPTSIINHMQQQSRATQPITNNQSRSNSNNGPFQTTQQALFAPANNTQTTVPNRLPYFPTNSNNPIALLSAANQQQTTAIVDPVINRAPLNYDSRNVVQPLPISENNSTQQLQPNQNRRSIFESPPPQQQLRNVKPLPKSDSQTRKLAITRRRHISLSTTPQESKPNPYQQQQPYSRTAVAIPEQTPHVPLIPYDSPSSPINDTLLQGYHDDVQMSPNVTHVQQVFSTPNDRLRQLRVQLHHRLRTHSVLPHQTTELQYYPASDNRPRSTPASHQRGFDDNDNEVSKRSNNDYLTANAKTPREQSPAGRALSRAASVAGSVASAGISLIGGASIVAGDILSRAAELGGAGSGYLSEVVKDLSETATNKLNEKTEKSKLKRMRQAELNRKQQAELKRKQQEEARGAKRKRQQEQVPMQNAVENDQDTEEVEQTESSDRDEAVELEIDPQATTDVSNTNNQFYWTRREPSSLEFYERLSEKLSRSRTDGRMHRYAVMTSTGARMGTHDTTIKEAYEEFQTRLPFTVKLAMKAAGIPDLKQYLDKIQKEIGKEDLTLKEAYDLLPFKVKLAMKAAGVPDIQQYLDRVHTEDGKVVIQPARTGSKMLHASSRHYPDWKQDAHRKLIEFIESNLDQFESLSTNEQAASVKARIGLLHHLQESNYNANRLNKIASHLKL
jgi:hypothetical protein